MTSQASEAPPAVRDRSYDELLQERAQLNTNIKAKTTQCEFEQNDADLGVEAAKSRADALRGEIEVLTERRRKLQALIDAAQARIQNEQATQISIDAAARPHKLAAACQERIELAQKAHAKFTEACDLLRQMHVNGNLIIELDGSAEARRLYSLGRFKIRLAKAFAKLLIADPSERGQGFGVPFLDYTLPFRGEEHFTKTLAELEIAVLDDLPLNLFQTREHADAACARRDPSGRQLHVKPQGDYFTIVSGELRGHAATQFAKGRPVK